MKIKEEKQTWKLKQERNKQIWNTTIEEEKEELRVKFEEQHKYSSNFFCSFVISSSCFFFFLSLMWVFGPVCAYLD